jgi:CheY-like chemotaxis protein
MKILYAEDDDSSRYLLETLLTAQQHDVVTATQGEAALQAIKQHSFDLIVSDILMPDWDGFDLCYQVKTDPVLSKIPFIFYSATYTQPDDIRFALSLGADRFLIKPIEPEQFLVEIEAVMKRAQELGVAKCQLDEHAFLVGHTKRITKKLSTTHLQRDAVRHKLEQTEVDLADARRLLGVAAR